MKKNANFQTKTHSTLQCRALNIPAETVEKVLFRHFNQFGL